MKCSSTRRAAVAALAFATAGCAAERATGPSRDAVAVVQFDIHGPAYVRLVSVEVTGPGIDSCLVFNVSIDSIGVGSGSLRVPAGADRHLVASAFDAAGIETHRGDTTVSLREGLNPELKLALRPLVGSTPVVITFGGSGIAMSPGDTILAVGDTVRFVGGGVDSLGNEIPAAGFTWSSTDPSIVSIDGSGLATARAAGAAFVLATHGGASLGRRVTVQ